MKNLLEVQGLATFYGRSQVLFGIELQVGEGEVVGLMGRNGMGKTTTLRSIMGLTQPKQGSICIGGIEHRGRPAFRAARAGLAIVPEGRQVFRQLTVIEHLLVARTRRNPFGEPWTVDRVFGLFPRLAERRDHRGDQLSGGEQQMLAIGRALMTNPKLILFDEATEGLAPMAQREIWSAIGALKERGYAILLVDKNPADVAGLTQRLYVLEKGRIAWTGRSDQLRDDAALQQRYLGI